MLHRCRVVSVVFLFLLCLIIPLNAANNQRGFQGYFNFRQVDASSAQVSVTLDVKLLNRTGTDVRGATISVHDSSQPKESYGSFPLLSIASGQVVDVSQAFTLPQREVQHWQRGGAPLFVISYTNSEGRTVQQRIALMRRPLKGGN